LPIKLRNHELLTLTFDLFGLKINTPVTHIVVKFTEIFYTSLFSS